jgi:Siphovirus ReqiPepy6 Gp37-like protein
MELLTLDGNYQPSELVERYASLIWTERYFTSGDFQLITTDVERMIKLLPLESMVTIRESTVPMVVEAYKIEKNPAGAPVLTITGRSFESILERRAAVAYPDPAIYQGEIWPARALWFEDREKTSDAAYHVLRRMLGDIERDRLPPDPPLTVPLPAVGPEISANDTLEMVDLTLPADYSEITSNKYEIKPGNLLTVVRELLTTGHHGLKAVRPEQGSNKIGIEIYNGANLTEQVVFDARFDQFENTTYLLSRAGSANMAYVFSKTHSAKVPKNALIQTEIDEPVGLDRRVIYVDISSEEGVDDPDSRRTRGLIELYKLNSTAIFDGQISQQIAQSYNRDYFLGDIIRLDGEYGLSQDVRVAEFIRSDDSTGSKAFPAFQVVDD